VITRPLGGNAAQPEAATTRQRTNKNATEANSVAFFYTRNVRRFENSRIATVNHQQKRSASRSSTAT
jgi:hypothetical protein